MSQTFGMVALRDFTAIGQDRLKGEHFEARPIEVAALTYQKLAIQALPRIEPDPEPLIVPEPDPVAPAEPEAKPRRRRSYRRRDMTAE